MPELTQRAATARAAPHGCARRDRACGASRLRAPRLHVRDQLRRFAAADVDRLAVARAELDQRVALVALEQSPLGAVLDPALEVGDRQLSAHDDTPATYRGKARAMLVMLELETSVRKELWGWDSNPQPNG
jgi:hypothetical protein